VNRNPQDTVWKRMEETTLLAPETGCSSLKLLGRKGAAKGRNGKGEVGKKSIGEKTKVKSYLGGELY